MICITRLSLIIYYGPNGCTCCHHPHHGHKEGFFNEASVKFNSDVLAEFLRNIYHGFDTSNEVEPTMWREILRIINEATVEGLSKAQTPPTHDKLFYEALRHSNEVFAAFKVHTMGVDMAAKLFDDKGKLKPFKQWVDDVSSISSHQVGSWLQTEYDTAVIRAHQAADWREFMRNKDVMPNLRWMPTTSPVPETTHEAFWQKRLNLPVDDPFWTKHHPGDHWNCKCSLEANDDDVVRPEDVSADKPQPGLDNNPGKDGHIFNDTHPYYPKDCAHCFANKSKIKNKLLYVFSGRAKDCYNCPFIDNCISFDKEDFKETYKSKGRILTSSARIAESKKSKDAKEIFDKEYKMLKVCADYGHDITYLKGENREIGGTYDILFDDIPADLKKTKSSGNIVKYARKALQKQGAKIVIFEFEQCFPETFSSMNEALRKYGGDIYYFRSSDKKLHKMKTPKGHKKSQ